jgi:DHA1 family tetracycline resistance protein-like MFS transporter
VTAKKSPLPIIFLTIFIDLVGFGIVFPVLPLYAERFGASTFTIGALVAIFSAMQLMAAPLLGKLSDRVGRRPVLLISIFGSGIGFVIMGAAGALWMLFLARIIDGASGGNISTAQAYIADVTPPENRSRAMGMIGAAFGLGFIFGPVLGGLLSQISLSTPFYFAAGLAFVNVILIYFRVPESLSKEDRMKPHDRSSALDVFHHGKGRVLVMVMSAYFFMITGFAIMTTLFALFTERRFGWDARHNGYIFAYIGVLGVIIQGGLLKPLLKIFNETALASFGAALLGVSMFMLPYSNRLGFLLVVSAGLALGNGLLTPTLNGLASKNVDRRWQGRAMGLMQSAGSMGRLLGPLLGGWLLAMDVKRPLLEYGRTPFWVGSGIIFVALALTLGLAGSPQLEAPNVVPQEN